ncbi:outer membrane protein [Devosia submarina]|uniref:outer membrane protein n=1 Tax=Devosia submarina TaxID=1173082 RepID=UPI0013002240|nr:outer membrane beta-barrel protein [Devosia submarina]
MKIAGLALTASLLLGVGSVAADPLILAPDASPSAIAEVQSYNWSGFHVGIFGGYLSSNASSELDSVEGALLEADVANGALPGSVSGSSGGALFGIGAGYDQQFGRFVLGIAGDVAWANADGSAEFRAIDPGTPFSPPAFVGQETVTSFQTNLNNLTTARLRAGVTADKALFYVTGGLAAGHVENEFGIALPGIATSFGPWSADGLLWGYSVGAGVEYAVTEDVTAKLEYLYYDFSDRSVRATDGAFPGQQITYRFLNNGGLVRAGLNFKF